MKETGLAADQCAIDEGVLRGIISCYTREAGVRQLERAIGRLARKVALRRVEGATEPVAVRAEGLGEWLGPERISPRQARKNLSAGGATGPGRRRASRWRAPWPRLTGGNRCARTQP